MTQLGYRFSSEEFGPTDLVRFATLAETAGFELALMSDHFHPWGPQQEGFIEFFEQQILPALNEAPAHPVKKTKSRR